MPHDKLYPCYIACASKKGRKIARTVAVQKNVAFADYDAKGNLLGLELLSRPSADNVIDILRELAGGHGWGNKGVGKWVRHYLLENYPRGISL